MSMIKWVIGTAAQYHAIVQKDQNSLYFLQDTQEIYKGDKSFTQSVIMVNDNQFPDKGAQGRIYINSSNLEGKIWTGTTWKTVIQPVATSLSDKVTEEKAVNGEAVKTYVKEKLNEAITGKFVDGITYDQDNKELKYTIGDQTTKVGIGGFVTGATYDGETGNLSFAVQGGQAINISLPKENFVKSGKYDKTAKAIILTLMDGSEVKIPAEDLIDINEFQSTNTVDLSASEDGIVRANVKISKNAKNQIKANDDGLYVEATDITGKLDKVDQGKADEIIIANADGTVRTSGKKAGGAALTGADENVLATEAAVSAIKSTLEASINVKFNKSDIVNTVGSVAAALDDKVASQKAVATAIEQLNNDKINKTNIATEILQDASSDDKVASQKAVAAALSWVQLS